MLAQTPQKTSFGFLTKIGFDEFENTVFVSKKWFYGSSTVEKQLTYQKRVWRGLNYKG